MRALRMLVWILSLFAVLPLAQAKIPYAYVANSGDNTVSVINTLNNTIVTTITVGTSPSDVAVNQMGTLAYVTNFGSNSVSVISTTTNAVTATITGFSGPAAVAFSPNGKTAYVTNSTSGTVAVISVGTHTVTKTVAAQTSPTGVAVTPNGAFVYVVNSGSGNVSVLSTLTNAVVATITVGTKPAWVAISPDGSAAYVTNSGSNTVSVIQTANNAVVNTINVSAGPYGAAVSPDGHSLYVANYNGGAGNLVTVIDTSTQTVATTIPVGTGPVGVAFTQDSAFAGVTNKGSNDVSVINTASRTVTRTIAVGVSPLGGAVLGPQKVSTVAGGYVGDKGPATSAAIDGPFNTVQDKAGNYYVSDRFNNRIRKITTTGTITTFAGTGICGYNGENISASMAILCHPAGLAFDSAGNLYVADTGNERVRKISTSGKITTVAGTGVYGYSGDGGPATSAALRNPFGIAFDSTGNLYFSEVANNIIRKVNTSGTISTYAGTGAAGFGGDGGPATSATMNQPKGIGFDTSGNLYIADSINGRVRIVSASGTINTFAGTGQAGCSGDGGPALSARIGIARGVNVNNGVLYIAAAGCSRVRAVNLSTNIISTFAGSSGGYDGDNNPPLSSRLNGPTYTLFDVAGNALIDDTFNGRVRKLSGGVITTFAGGYVGNGVKATSAALLLPEALAIDKSTNLYIADWAGHRIRKVSGGTISTIAGNGVNGYSGDGGLAINAMLNFPQGVAVDSLGNVFIADELNGVVRKVDTAGNISTFATNANFFDLYQMAVDAANNLYVADDAACVVWKITSAAVVSIAAGVLNTCGYNGDGILATTAQLNGPFSVTFDSGGNMFIADNGNSRVREVNTSGVIGTIAGNGTCGYTGDGGSATSAELCPNSVAVDKSGVIYVADFNFGRIRKIKGGTITTFAGSGYGPGGNVLFNGDGLWPLYTSFTDPVVVAVDSKGAVYELDDFDQRVRKIQ